MQAAVADLGIEHSASNAKNTVSLSMGLAWCEPESGWQLEQLIAAADEALYTSKDNGRDRMSEVVELQPELLFHTS